MNAILLAHANCDGCKSPDEIQQHLARLGNEFYAQQMVPNGPDFGEISQLQYDGMSVGSDSMLQDGYYSSLSPENDSVLTNPPLPEFNQTASFDIHTPLQTD